MYLVCVPMSDVVQCAADFRIRNCHFNESVSETVERPRKIILRKDSAADQTNRLHKIGFIHALLLLEFPMSMNKNQNSNMSSS